MTDLDQLLGQLEQDLARERGLRGRLRGLGTPWRLVVAAAVAALVGAVMLVATPRADLAIYPGHRLAIDLGLMLVPLAAALVLVLRGLHRPLPPARANAIALLGALGAATVLVLLPPAHMDHPASLVGNGADFVPRALACFAFGLGWGLPAGLLVQGMVRHDGVSPLAWVAGGLVGMAALVLHCPIVHGSHLAAGHLMVLLTVTGGALLASRIRRPGAGSSTT